MNRTPHRLPPELQADLEDAFAAEVRPRLRRLMDAAIHLNDDPHRAVGAFLSDAHAIASSAAIVGEDVAAHAARECEQLLRPYSGRGTVPVAVAALACGAAEAVCLALVHLAGEVVPAQSGSWRS